MAYVTSLNVRFCSVQPCGRPATLSVNNQYNAPVNYFCERHRKHAERLADSISERERWQGRAGDKVAMQ